MYIDRVTAVSFGAIKDKTLKLHKGLTVVVGSNGTGKSTWHAALYAALCGHRQTTLPFDQEFEELWIPEDEPEWAVSCELHFDDGRHFEVQQDLGHGRSTIIELPSGATAHIDDRTADLAEEIHLDRYSYAATAWVDHQTARIRSAGSEGLARSVGLYVKDREVQKTIAWLDAARQRLNLSGSEGRRAQAQHEFERLQAEDNHRKEVRRRHAELSRQLEHAREASASSHRLWKLAKAAVARAAVRQLEEAIERLSPMQDRFMPLGAYGYGEPAPSDTEVHESVAEAARALDDAEAVLDAIPTPPPAPLFAEPPVPSQAPLTPPTRSSPLPFVLGLVLAVLIGVAATQLPGLGRIAAFAVAALVAFGAIVLQLRRRPPIALVEIPSAPESDPVSASHVQQREAARRSVIQAEDQLIRAIHARGVQSGLGETARQILDRYRAECDKVADSEGVDRVRLADLRERLDLARQEATLAAQGFMHYEIPEANDVDVYALHTQWMDADAKVESAKEALLSLASQLTDVDAAAGIDGALRSAEDTVNRLQLLDETLRTTREYLDRARTNTLERIAEGVQDRLWEYLVSIVGHGVDVRVDPETMCVNVAESPRGKRNGHRSDSTEKLSIVFARIALGQHLGRQGEETGPLLLDDIVSQADDDRLCRALDQLLPISDRRQVVIFAQQEATAQWARRARQSRPQIRLIRLTGVDDDPTEDVD